MPYINNPLLEDNLQKKLQTTELTTTDGTTYKFDELMSLINSKIDKAQGSTNHDKILGTDNNGDIYLIDGYLMNIWEREKLDNLTNPMVLKGTKDSVAEIIAIENPSVGWCYFIPSSNQMYCYLEEGWKLIGSVSVSLEYTYSDPVTISVGGIKKGTTLLGKRFNDILHEMLSPYVAISNFKISTNITGPIENGTQVKITKIVPSFTIGSKAIEGFVAYDSDGSVIGQNATGATISGLDVSSNSISAKITDGTTELTASWAVQKVDPYFYGIVDSSALPTDETITSLNKVVASAVNATLKFTARDKYCCFAYPASEGTISKIIDSNGYIYDITGGDFKISSCKISVLSGDVLYNVVVQQKAATITDFAFTFKF